MVIPLIDFVGPDKFVVTGYHEVRVVVSLDGLCTIIDKKVVLLVLHLSAMEVPSLIVRYHVPASEA
jgi:hypothetical protein